MCGLAIETIPPTASVSVAKLLTNELAVQGILVNAAPCLRIGLLIAELSEPFIFC